MSEPLVLTLSCADRPGITARVTSFLFERGGNILEAQQFNDRSSDAFFMRVEFDPGEASREMIRTEFAPIAAEHAMDWKLALRDRPRRVMIMVSKFDHCLADLLYRWRIGEAKLSRVANREKMMPASFITRDGFGITQRCRTYLEPLMKGEDYPPYRNGLPRYVRLKNTAVPKKLKTPFAL